MAEIIQFQQFLADLKIVEITDESSLIDFVDEHAVRFKIDPDSGRKVALSRLILNLVPFDYAHVLVLETGVWPSSKLTELHTRLRASNGIHSSVLESPFEKCSSQETSYLECLCFCGLSFFWSFAIVFPEKPLIIYVDEDEWMGVCTPDPDLLKSIVADFKKYGLKKD